MHLSCKKGDMSWKQCLLKESVVILAMAELPNGE